MSCYVFLYCLSVCCHVLLRLESAIVHARGYKTPNCILRTVKKKWNVLSRQVIYWSHLSVVVLAVVHCSFRCHCVSCQCFLIQSTVITAVHVIAGEASYIPHWSYVALCNSCRVTYHMLRAVYTGSQWRRNVGANFCIHARHKDFGCCSTVLQRAVVHRVGAACLSLAVVQHFVGIQCGSSSIPCCTVPAVTACDTCIFFLCVCMCVCM